MSAYRTHGRRFLKSTHLSQFHNLMLEFVRVVLLYLNPQTRPHHGRTSPKPLLALREKSSDERHEKRRPR